MATTHVFIVDKNTFKYHLEYLFAGTGAKDYFIDFNDNDTTKLHSNRELLLVGMIADLERIRQDDFIIFYLQQNFSSKIYEGKFYGIFQVKSIPFLDNNDDNQFLKEELKKSLTFRILLKPYKVYAKGVTEWEALDEIKNITSPYQMLWSLIYRKLKGNRGNTMITLYESERLISLIRNKNKKQQIDGNHFSFSEQTNEIIKNGDSIEYKGKQEKINIFKRLVARNKNNLSFENHLQAYILKHIGNNTNQSLDNALIGKNNNIEWLGNEVSCGVGMQRIDICISLKKDEYERILIPIELKAVEISNQDVKQMSRYIDWINQYYIPNKVSDIYPVLICKKQNNKETDEFIKIKNNIKSFNEEYKLNLKLIEFEIKENGLYFLNYQF